MVFVYWQLYPDYPGEALNGGTHVLALLGLEAGKASAPGPVSTLPPPSLPLSFLPSSIPFLKMTFELFTLK